MLKKSFYLLIGVIMLLSVASCDKILDDPDDNTSANGVGEHTYLSYTNISLGTEATSSYASFVNTTDGQTVNEVAASSDAADIDFGFYYQNKHYLWAVDAHPSLTETWATKTSTKFSNASTPLAEWDEIDDSYFSTDTQGGEPSASSIDCTIPQIIFFKNAQGKYGFIKIVKSAQYTGTGGFNYTTEMEIKIQI